MKAALTTIIVLVAVPTLACGSSSKGGGKGGAAAASGPAGAVRTVIIIDDGFDVTAPVLKGKIAGSYTAQCPDTSDDNLDWDNLSAADLKQHVLANIQSQVPCTLADTLTFNLSTAFTSIESDRTVWNQGILTKQGVSLSPPQITTITGILGGENGQYDYHGTATSGTIAYANDQVQLVLVQLKLQEEDQVKTAVQCHHQAGVDKFVATLQEADVLNAYVTAPVDPTAAKLNQIATDHGVTVASLSLGAIARTTMQQVYASKGCGTVDLTAYFNLQRELNDKRSAYLTQQGENGPDVLTIQAAGNDGVSAMTPADSQQCSDLANDTMIIGSYDSAHKLSTFSNYGACVDLYSFGDSVVVAAPDGFVNVESGTSFSTPMVVRHLTLTYPASTSIKDLEKGLAAEADANHYLPATSYPEELAYADKSTPVASYSLAAAALPSDAAWRRARAAETFRRLWHGGGR